MELEESLKNGFSYFLYKKEDGELRDTFATLDPKITPTYQFKGGKSTARNEAILVTAWENNKCMWRTFRVDRIVKIYV